MVEVQDGGRLTRKERRQLADNRRNEITLEIYAVLRATIDLHKDNPREGLLEGFKTADAFVLSEIKKNPREAHMFRSAALAVRMDLEHRF